MSIGALITAGLAKLSSALFVVNSLLSLRASLGGLLGLSNKLEDSIENTKRKMLLSDPDIAVLEKKKEEIRALESSLEALKDKIDAYYSRIKSLQNSYKNGEIDAATYEKEVSVLSNSIEEMKKNIFIKRAELEHMVVSYNKFLERLQSLVSQKNVNTPKKKG